MTKTYNCNHALPQPTDKPVCVWCALEWYEQNETLRRTLRSDEEQLKQWAKRHAEMRDDLIRAAQTRDALVAALKKLVDRCAMNNRFPELVEEARAALALAESPKEKP